MKAIGQIIAENKTLTHTHSPSSLTTTQTWMKKYPTPSQIEHTFSPMQWQYASSNPEKAYLSDSPSLKQYSLTFGEKTAEKWIYMQIMALYGSSSNTDKGVADGIHIFAASFAKETSTYKLSELLLFFARYKAGRYDNSYHSFDTRRIGNAFFREFLPERQRELDRITRDQEQQRIESRRFTPPQGHTSLSWYHHLKERASQGDQEAITLLNHPSNP